MWLSHQIYELFRVYNLPHDGTVGRGRRWCRGYRKAAIAVALTVVAGLVVFAVVVVVAAGGGVDGWSSWARARLSPPVGSKASSGSSRGAKAA